MPEHPFVLTALLQVLENDIHLGEALFFPEVSCLEDTPADLVESLLDNAQKLLRRDDTGEHHRRKGTRNVQAGTVDVELEPPPHSAAWRSAIPLSLPVVRWQHGEDAAIAFVPALGIEVVAPDPDALEHVLRRHVLSAILRLQARRLDRLAWIGRSQSLLVETVPFSLELPTPRQHAIAERETAKRQEPVLIQVADNLTSRDLAPAYEVDALVSRLAEALTGRSPRGVLLVGPSGVGKTAVLYELVRQRHSLALMNRPFWSTSGARLVAGMSGFGMWQERCQKVLLEAGRTQAILHLGNLMELLEVGKSEHQQQGLASFLRPWLARGELLAVAECTPEQLPLIERHDPHLVRAFAQLRVDEPAPDRLENVLARFAKARGSARLAPDGLSEILRLHRRYATYSANPGRPLRFLRNLLADQPRDQPITAPTVTAAFSRETGLPRVLLEESVPLDLTEARQWFAARVIGQSEAVDLVVDLLATVKAVLNRPRKPIASLLFIGPTGVGKTEMAKALAAFLFGSPDRLTRFDMSEYGDALAVQRLIGGAGTTEGLLTARVREQPFAVILLDEVEKADPQLFDLLLQVLGEGRLTDAAGRLADFCNSVVIMTSNLGAETYLQGQFGFLGGGAGRLEARQHFVAEVRKAVRPELFNRIDRIVPFAPLDEDTIRLIAGRQLDLLHRRDGIRYRGVTLELEDDLRDWLARTGHDPRYGARPLKRAIERQLLAPLAARMNDYTAATALRVQVGVKGDELKVQVRARTDAAGQQVAQGGIGQAERDVAENCQSLRRALQSVQNCSALLEVVNEIYRMERLPRREFYDADLAELRRLRDTVQSQMDEAVAREDEALLELYGERERGGDSAPASGVASAPRGRLEHLRKPLSEAQGRFAEIVMDLFLRQFGQANQVTLSVFSEDVETLLTLTSAYFQAAGAMRSLAVYQFLPAARQGEVAVGVPVRIGDVTYQYLPPARSGEPLTARKVLEVALLFEPDKPDRWKGVIGAALEMGGKAACARFIGEAGLHVIQTPRQTGRALICTSEGGISRHMPPEGIERRGAIGNQARRRTYRLEAEQLDDERLGSRALPGRTVAEALPGILDDTLWLAARSILEQ